MEDDEAVTEREEERAERMRGCGAGRRGSVDGQRASEHELLLGMLLSGPESNMQHMGDGQGVSDHLDSNERAEIR